MTAGTAARLDDAELARLATDIQRRLGVRATRNEPLAQLTTMRVGGPADLFARVHNLFELRGLVRFARSRDLPVFMVGRGSDLVISDAGMRGLPTWRTRVGMCDSAIPMRRPSDLFGADWCTVHV